MTSGMPHSMVFESLPERNSRLRSAGYQNPNKTLPSAACNVGATAMLSGVAMLLQG
jgi:hypothetical protein